jgi:thioredoxin-dependent peroxiredoxin
LLFFTAKTYILMATITLGGKPTNTSGNLPATGTKAPDFTLTKSDMTEITLAELKGRRVILNIFPSVDTRVCSTSVRQFNAKAASLQNTTVVCVSMDLPFAQARFCGAEGIQNTIVASNFRDDGSFAQAYGVGILDGGFRGLNARAVVVIDEDGTVKYTEMVPEIGQEPNYEAAMAAL